MLKPDFPEFRQLLDAQAEVFAKPKLSDIAVQAYWSALRDIPLEVVRASASAHLRRGKFFPKPSELRPKDWRPTISGTGRLDVADDIARLAGVHVHEALGDQQLRAKLEAHLAWLNSGPNESASSKASFASAYWASVETWLEWQVGGQHADARHGSMA